MSAATNTVDRAGPGDTWNLVLATLIPLAAFALQWFFWAAIQPFVWFLFYPAVFFSSRVDGLRGGLVATVLSTILVWYFFVPPQFSFAVQSPVAFVTMAVFVGMGFLFGLTHERLRKMNRRVTEALAASNSNLEAALASMTDAVFISDSEGRFIEFNESFATFHKFRNKEECAKTLAEYPAFLEVYLPNGDLAPLEQWAVPRALRGETVANAEYTLRRKDTGETWVGSYSFSPIREKGGTIVGSVVTGRDITQRKQAEERLSASEARYRSLFENMAEGLADCQMLFDGDRPQDFIYLSVNRAFEKLTGLKNVEGRKVSEVIPGVRESDPALFEIYGRVARGGAPERFENYVEPLKMWFEVSVFSLGRDRFVALFDVVTSRKQTEAALRESEDKFRYFFDRSNVGKSITRLSGEVQVNQAFCDMLGYSPAELQQRSWQAITHPEDVEPTRRMLDQLISGKEESSRRTKRYLRKGGSVVWGDISTTLRRDPAGQPLYFMTAVIDVTEQKRAEETLRFQQAMLEETGRIAKVGGWKFDAVTGEGFWTDEVARIHDLDPALPVSREIGLQYYASESRPIIESAVKAAVEEGRPYDLELEIISATGVRKSVRTIGHPVRENGRIIQVRGTLQDITQQRLAEAALRESQALYYSLVDQLPAGVFRKDREGRYVLVSPWFCRLKGMKAEEFLGKTAEEVAASETAKKDKTAQVTKYAAEGMTQHALVMQSGHPVESLEDYADAAGGKQFIQALRTPVYSPEGKIVGTQGILFDITARKEAEEALRESENRFRTMADSIPQLAWIAKADGFIFWYNRRWYDYTGTTPAQMEGWGWQSVHDPAVLAKVMENWTGAIASGQPFEMEFPLRGADGQFRKFLTRGQPLKDPAGKVVQWFGTNTDVDELKRVEDKVRQFNAQLEQRVRERTDELESSNRELEAFSYSVSHDLRAPLRSIDGFSRIVMEDYAAKLDDEGRDSLQRIRAATHHMAELIDDLLKLSRVTRTEMHREPVDLSGMARAVAGELDRQQPGRTVTLTVTDGVRGDGDPRLLRVVLENLLGNAWKFTGKRTDARVEFGAISPGGQTAYFVRDNGAGFDPAFAGKMFGAFQRLHSSADFPGTGVGLATVQRIIHRHGGRVWAESQVEQGATFYFSLGSPVPTTSTNS